MANPYLINAMFGVSQNTTAPVSPARNRASVAPMLDTNTIDHDNTRGPTSTPDKWMGELTFEASSVKDHMLQGGVKDNIYPAREHLIHGGGDGQLHRGKKRLKRLAKSTPSVAAAPSDAPPSAKARSKPLTTNQEKVNEQPHLDESLSSPGHRRPSSVQIQHRDEPSPPVLSPSPSPTFASVTEQASAPIQFSVSTEPTGTAQSIAMTPSQVETYLTSSTHLDAPQAPKLSPVALPTPSTNVSPNLEFYMLPDGRMHFIDRDLVPWADYGYKYHVRCVYFEALCYKKDEEIVYLKKEIEELRHAKAGVAKREREKEGDEDEVEDEDSLFLPEKCPRC